MSKMTFFDFLYYKKYIHRKKGKNLHNISMRYVDFICFFEKILSKECFMIENLSIHILLFLACQRTSNTVVDNWESSKPHLCSRLALFKTKLRILTLMRATSRSLARFGGGGAATPPIYLGSGANFGPKIMFP